MQEFVYYAPTEIIFEKNAESQTGKEIRKWGGNRVLIVYGGGSVKKSGLLGRIEEELKQEKIAFLEWGGVKTNPGLSLPMRRQEERNWKIRRSMML